MSEKSFVLPKPYQLGYVVKDLDESIHYFESLLGMPVDSRIEFSPDKHWIGGEPHPVTVAIAFFRWNGMEIELNQPISSPVHQEFLERVGDGLQHVAYYVDDYEGWIEHLTSQGFKMVMNAEWEDKSETLRAAFFDTASCGGVLTEIMEKPKDLVL